MTTFEDLIDNPSTEVKNSRGAGWVKCIQPQWMPFSIRLRDAWEVVQGRALALRQSTAEDAERRAKNRPTGGSVGVAQLGKVLR